MSTNITRVSGILDGPYRDTAIQNNGPVDAANDAIGFPGYASVQLKVESSTIDQWSNKGYATYSLNLVIRFNMVQEGRFENTDRLSLRHYCEFMVSHKSLVGSRNRHQ